MVSFEGQICEGRRSNSSLTFVKNVRGKASLMRKDRHTITYNAVREVTVMLLALVRRRCPTLLPTTHTTGDLIPTSRIVPPRPQPRR